MKKSLLILAAGIALTSSLNAGDVFYKANNSNWNTVNAWSVGSVSGGANATWTNGDNAFLTTGGGQINLNTGITAGNVTISDNTRTIRVNNGASSLTVTGTYSDISTTSYDITSGTTNYTLGLNFANDATLNATLKNTSASLSFTKSGAGNLTVASTAHTYTGATAVTVGTMVVTGSIATSSGINVSNNATLAGESSDLGVTNGKVSAITLNGGEGFGSILAPGNGSAADLGSLYGTSLAWNGATSAFSQMKFDLSNSSAASDQLILSGAMTKPSGSFFTFDFGGTGDAVTARTYTLLTTGAGGLAGWSALDFTAIGLNAGIDSGSFAIVGDSLQFSTVVPEPATWALLAGSLTTVMVLRRRRRA